MGKIKIICRIFSWLLLALALMAVGAEAVASLRAGAWQPMSLGQFWSDLDRGSLNMMQALVQRYLAPAIWDPGVIAVLQWPTWLIILIPAAIFLLLGHRRHQSR